MAYKLDSIVQHGCNPGGVVDDIDYGPYTSDQWSFYNKLLFTSDQEATQGVVRGFEDELEVSGAGVNVTVKQGAGICNGHFIVGLGAPDWTVAVVPPTAGHTRCDYVVMLENNTAGVYAPGVATMECPGTADYGGIADQVPEYACRLAVIKGAEDAACPPGSLSQTTNLWMTPLASIEWNVSQTIDTVTDLRYYIHEYDVDILIPAVNGYDDTASDWITPGSTMPWQLSEDHEANIYGTWRVPPDYVRGLVLGPVLSSGTNTYRAEELLNFGSLGQSKGIHWDDVAAANYAGGAVGNIILEPFTHTLTAAVIGDYLSIQFVRHGAHVDDTAFDMYFFGWRVQYTAAVPWD